MYGKYLRIYDKANLKTKVSSDSSRDNLIVLTKFFTVPNNIFQFQRKWIKVSDILLEYFKIDIVSRTCDFKVQSRFRSKGGRF